MLTPRREGRKWIVRFDPDFDPDEGGMEFRLTYEGPLRASNGGRDTRPARKDHKHTIRKAFHEQLKVLWETTPFLKRGTSGGPNLLSLRSDYKKPPTTAEELAAAHAHYGFNFVPLVTEELGLMCSLDILYLRRAKPGDVLEAFQRVVGQVGL